jgi:nucleotide-binding universal stress UspA family protein
MKPREPQRILVATDFSSCSQPALDYAALMARRFGASLHLVYVAQPPTFVSPEAIGIIDSALDAEVAEGKRRMEEALRQLRDVDLRASGTVVIGFAADMIVALANEKKHDLVVLGTHGRSGLKHVLLGSVAEQVVRRSHIPVLTLRPAAPEERPAL